MYKQDLALNNVQWLICHKTQPNHTKPNQTILLHFHGAFFKALIPF